MNVVQASLNQRIQEFQSSINRIQASQASLDERTDYARQHVALIRTHNKVLKILRDALAEENQYLAEQQ